MHSASAERSHRPASASDPANHQIEADLQLDASISTAGVERGDATNTVLLTGGTGFLGVYLLRDLLRHSANRVVCLVRADNAAHALERLKANASKYELIIGPAEWSRVEALPADLSLPRLGLEADVYARLARNVDAVFHGAAVVNFYQTYLELRATNVEGTREILRFVVQSRLKVLHYVSTTGVFDSDAARGVVVREDTTPAHCEGSVMGYTQAKWVAEQLVLTARERGIQASVYRTPFILGDSETGAVDEDNLVVKMLVGSVQGGAWPDEPTDVEMVPVNALSRAIVHLAQEPANLGRTFHVTSPSPMRWADIGLAARAYGYALALPPYAEWKLQLAEFGRRKGNAMRPLVRFYTKVPPRLTAPAPEVFTRQPRPIFDSTLTQQALAGAGLVPPRMDHGLFARYLDYFVRKGWLPSPGEMKVNPGRSEKRSGGSRPPQFACGTPA